MARVAASGTHVGAAIIQWLRLTLATAVAAARGTNTRAPVATHGRAARRALISSTQQRVTNGRLDRIDECAGPKHFEHCSLALHLKSPTPDRVQTHLAALVTANSMLLVWLHGEPRPGG